MTDDELYVAALVTKADVARAVALWHELAPRWARALVDGAANG